MKKLLLVVLFGSVAYASSQEVQSTGLSGGFRVAGSGGDDYYDSPWYGLGQSSYVLPGTTGPIVQLAGYFGLNFATANGKMAILSDGTVGIGTTIPDASLDAVGTTRLELTNAVTSAQMDAGHINDVLRINAPYSSNPSMVSNAGAAWGIRFIGTTNTGSRDVSSKGPAIFAVSEDSGAGYNRANGLALYTNTMDQAAAERFRITNSGDVGIGITAPAAKLDVQGNIKLSGTGAHLVFPDGETQSVPWNGTTCGGDYAESVDVGGNRKAYEPGDVLVIDPEHEGGFLKSSEPYATGVTGVFSTKPGLTGRRQLTAKSDEEVPMAMVGIVPTKVSAENGAIKPGDLLVSSSKPGYAMKGTDRPKMLGAVIGKALGHLDKGTGVIEVVILMQ